MVSMLTTVDNPYDPFTEFDKWNDYDQTLGHHTTAYLARIVVTSDELSEADQEIAIEDAINEIVQMNINGLYTKVTMKDEEKKEDGGEGLEN